MLKIKRHRRFFSRLISGLFAVHLIAAGFCLMMPQALAHAVPMVKIAHSMSASVEHCMQSMEDQMGQDADHSSYSHCDQLDSLLQNVSTPIQLDIDMQADLLPVPTAPDWSSQSTALFSRTPTGPPRSSSLLYHISPRILI